MTVTAQVELLSVEGRKLVFAVEASDGMDVIARGTHERYIIQRQRFDDKVAAKLAQFHAQCSSVAGGAPI